MPERLLSFDEPTIESTPKKKGAKSRKKSPINDLNLDEWREYEDILTDSLWLIPERDRSGTHMADYHGNFVPQIPYQAMRRFTKQGDVLLDAFLGSGTSLIECRRLGRHGVGIELKPELALQASERIAGQGNPYEITTQVLTGDSSDLEAAPSLIAGALKGVGRESVQLAILHPPYHSIIRFSDREEDLSNCPNVEEFLQRFGRVVDVIDRFLEKDRYLVLVIGDIYADAEWAPLGFYCMQEVMGRGYSLKSLVVKDMQGNRAKRNLEKIWRYRALAGGFYIFKHEYVMFFRKVGKICHLSPKSRQASSISSTTK
jgi:DNA methylase